MSTTGYERGGKRLFGSTARVGNTTLPPKQYLTTNKNKTVELPNLTNKYNHIYKSKHFQFGTSLPTSTYQDELARVTQHCQDMTKALNLVDEDMSWVGDEIKYQDTWPLNSSSFQVAQLNVNGFSFAKDNFKIDLYLQGLMALQVDISAIQEINLNLTLPRVKEALLKAMKRFDQRASLQMAILHHKESSNVYQPGGNAIWGSGFYTGRIVRKGQDKYGRWAYTVLTGKGDQEVMIISAYNTCKNAPDDGGTIAGQLLRQMHRDGEKKRFNLRQAFFNDLQEVLNKEQEKGTEIVLAMDANTEATSEELKTLLLNTNIS